MANKFWEGFAGGLNEQVKAGLNELAVNLKEKFDRERDEKKKAALIQKWEDAARAKGIKDENIKIGVAELFMGQALGGTTRFQDNIFDLEIKNAMKDGVLRQHEQKTEGGEIDLNIQRETAPDVIAQSGIATDMGQSRLNVQLGTEADQIAQSGAATAMDQSRLKVQKGTEDEQIRIMEAKERAAQSQSRVQLLVEEGRTSKWPVDNDQLDKVWDKMSAAGQKSLDIYLKHYNLTKQENDAIYNSFASLVDADPDNDMTSDQILGLLGKVGVNPTKMPKLEELEGVVRKSSESYISQRYPGATSYEDLVTYVNGIHEEAVEDEPELDPAVADTLKSTGGSPTPAGKPAPPKMSWGSPGGADTTMSREENKLKDFSLEELMKLIP